MTKITLIKGDITSQKVDAIVNSANRTLGGGGGVDGAIHDVAGAEMDKKCDLLGGCNVGGAKITKGYNLLAKYVIHTVGPDYGYEKGQDAELLKACYMNSLKLAKEYRIKTIAFPAISVGIFHYPLKEATVIAIESVKSFIKKEPELFQEIRFVAFTDEVYQEYANIISSGLRSIGDIIKEY